MQEASINQTNWTQMAIGLAGLVLGTTVYLVDRPSEPVFVHSIMNLFHLTPNVFGWVGGSLPAFAHVFAFILLTAALVNGTRQTVLTVCLGWFLVDLGFELGQHPQVAGWLSTLLPQWFDNVPVLDRIDSYFLHGTFDPIDMLSIVLGTLAAYFVTQRPHSQKHE